jgi:hypothetical protein
MIFPTDPDDLRNAVVYLIDRCMSTREDRDRLYTWREQYYLFGTSGYMQSRYNRLESHLDLVSSFLYAPDGAFYNIAAQNSMDDLEVARAKALQMEFNDDFQEAGVTDAIMQAVPYSLVYDTMLTKQGWHRETKQWFCELVSPKNFGVYREEIADLDKQSCFCHSYNIEYQDAVFKLIRAGKKDDIYKLKTSKSSEISPFPEMLQRMIIAGTGGSNLAGTVFGQVNPDYNPTTNYQPKTEVDLVRFNELWTWDDTTVDYRTFHMIEPDILLYDSKEYIEAYDGAKEKGNILLFKAARNLGLPESRSNPFLPGEHPFAKIQPYQKFNNFWGKAHIDALIPLQEWMLERLDQIADILEQQADPPKSGFGMLGLTEETMAAWGGAGTYMMDAFPNAKVERHAPTMPEDLFAEYKEIASLFLEASGLTDLTSGKGEKGVRSGSHARELKKTGSGRIMKAALAIEPALTKIGDIGLKLKMANDDEKITAHDSQGKPFEFLPAKVGNVKLRISGHEHSPLFSDSTKELAVAMLKMDVIDKEMFVIMLRPPGMNNILHGIREKAKKEAEMIRAHPELAQQMMHKRGRQRGGQRGGR